MARYALGFGLLCGVLLSGCNNSAPPKKPPQPASPEVSITTASWEQIQKNIAEKHRGKIVVVDVWSVWCEPCMKELPELASLQAKHPDDLACLTLTIKFRVFYLSQLLVYLLAFTSLSYPIIPSSKLDPFCLHSVN